MSDLLSCTRCSFSLDPKPVPMQVGYGLGRILLVGEAPGEEEVRQHIPFVGGAGKVLNLALHHAGLKRGDFFVTNIIHCRPPSNRTPTSEEIGNCSSWLEKEIEKIQPSLLVALGDTATRALTNKTLEWRGSVVESKFGTPCLITYHPAFIMRSRTDFPVLVADLKKLNSRPSTVKEVYLVKPPEHEARSLLEKWRRAGRVLAVDLETGGPGGGLNPWTDEIAGYAVSGEPGEGFHYSLPQPVNESKTDFRWLLLKEIVERDEVCWQNNCFDRTFLILKGAHPKQPVWDTMDAMYVLNSSSEKSLDFLRSIYTSIPPYKKAVRRKGYEELSANELAIVNILDVDVTKQVMRAQKPYFDPTQLTVLQRQLALDTQAIIMRVRGVPVDKEVMAKNFLDIEPELERLEQKFYDTWQVNPNSPKQLAALLYDTLHLPLPPKRRGKAERSTDEESVKWLSASALEEEQTTLLDDLLSYRDGNKVRGTFVQGWFQRIGPDGRLHPQWNTTGTDTGRWSCTDPNMQNPPQRVRNQVVAPEGRMFIGADYKNLEFLIMLIISQDWDNVHAICYEGRDIHGEMNEEMNKYSSTPIPRIIVKTVVFGTAYGRSPHSISRQFKVPLFVAKGWQELCFGRFPKLAALAERHRKMFREKGYAESFFGRRKYCEVETQALNHPVQSTAADITHNACLSLEKAGFNPIVNIHDELLCEIDAPASYEETLKTFETIMNNAGKPFHDFFPCKPRISKSWQKEEE